MTDLTGLPGADLVREGLADLGAGRDTPPAFAVAVAAARLRRLGIPVPRSIDDAELKLYHALGALDPPSAYSRYNALLRQIDSFARALEREQGKALRGA